jgi:hypothetical protein
LLQFRYEKGVRRIIALGRGELTADDIRTFLDWQILEGFWEYGVLYDLRSVTAMPAQGSRTELAGYVTSMASHLPQRGPVATVTRDPAIVEAVTAFAEEAARSGLRVRAFNDETDAVRWLNEETGEGELRFVDK